ncbi:DNA-3-methyladenine glycosylase [bacterium]|nr:DNA-3-methyladenine glycosylase [bacterium]
MKTTVITNLNSLMNQYSDHTPSELLKLAKPLERSFYERNARIVAHDLIGTLLIRRLSNKILAGFIVEVEAYRQNEPACHAFNGKTKRTAVMFGPPGRSYIYFIYGMYWCLNTTAEPDGIAAACLIRAVEPVSGLNEMMKLRKKTKVEDLCSGPGKLSMAFNLTGDLNNHDLSKSPLIISALEDGLKPQIKVRKSPRIGLTEAKDLPYRFYVQGNPHVSK